MLTAVAITSGAPARSAPDPARTVPTSTTLSLRELGATTPLSFYGDQGMAELTFPVPRGVIPAALHATVELPVKVRSGLITATQGDRTIARLPLPPTDQAPVAMPLPGVTVADNAATVTLRVYLTPIEGYCLDPTNPLRLTDGSVSFTGTEAAPSSVADFLPPVLKKLTIAIPPNPAGTESDAAVRLAAAVTARYGRQPTAVVVVPLGTPVPSAPFERQILIQHGAPSGLALRGTQLLITGTDNELINQTRLLSRDLSRLAMSSKAVVGPLRSSPQLPGDRTTLSALGQPTVSAVALSPQLAVGLDQTRMGRPAKGIRVHLTGSYTPLPGTVSGRLVAIVGPETIATWAVDERGVIDRWVDIPDGLLQRYTTLGIWLNVAGNTGRCGEFQPLTLTVDGASTVQSTAAVPPVPGGLQSVPQALMPRTNIGIGPDAYPDTVRAVMIATALQRLSALPIDTAVTGVDEALQAGGPAVIIAADGWNRTDTPLPVGVRNATVTLDGVASDGYPTTLTLGPDLHYGALEAFFDGRRSLLVATSNAAPDQLDQLLRWIGSDPRRWSQLDGVAVISAAGREPVVVRPQAGVTASPGPSRGITAGMLGIGGAFAAAVTGAGLTVLRTRRRRVGD